MAIFSKFFRKKQKANTQIAKQEKEEEQVNIIRELRGKGDIDGLLEILREDPDKSIMRKLTPLTKKAAISAIGEIGDERAIDSLVQVLSWEKIVEKTFHSTKGPSSVYDEKTGFFITKQLVDEYTFTRIAAAEALAKAGKERGTEYLLQALKHDDHSVRMAAAISLANLGDERAVKTLIECLDYFPIWYIDVIEALGKLKSREALGHLEQIVGGGSADARCAAAEALGKIGDEKAIRPLIMALMEKPVDEKAAKALRDLGVEEDIIVRGSEFAARRDNPYRSLDGDEIEFALRLAKEALEKIQKKQEGENGIF